MIRVQQTIEMHREWDDIWQTAVTECKAIQSVAPVIEMSYAHSSGRGGSESAQPSSNKSALSDGCAIEVAILERFFDLSSVCHASTAFGTWLERTLGS